MKPEIIHEAENQRFVLLVDGISAGEIDYTVDATGALCATHTEVNSEFSGQGYAALLVDALVAFAEQEHIGIIPACSYVAARFAKNPEKYKNVILL